MKFPPIELPAAWIAGLNVGGWLLVQLALAWAVTRLPVRLFTARRPPRPTRRAHRGPDLLYDRMLHIKRWKDRLPDGASWFAGGFAKRGLARRTPDYLARFSAETRRGETCHWLALACTPVFFLWNPWWGNLVVAAYAVAANVPCILVQRYNRRRLGRVARQRDGTRSPHPPKNPAHPSR